jgi:flagellin-specific chaperone FliS
MTINTNNYYSDINDIFKKFKINLEKKENAELLNEIIDLYDYYNNNKLETENISNDLEIKTFKIDANGLIK